MQIKNCRNCKRLFNYIAGQQFCPTCMAELEEKFQKAKTYINDNKGASIEDVASEADVSESQVLQWIREERLVFASSSVSGIVCESCGTPIATGRFCDKCKTATVNGFNSIVQKDLPQQSVVKTNKESSRMRFFDTR